MKRIFFFLCAALCTVTGIFVAKKLPADNSELISEKYSTWAGVIRIWADKDCLAGGWLNACAEKFEKAHAGVYINVQELSSGVLSEYATSGVNTPDILIYTDGVIDNTAPLIPISKAYPLRDGIHSSTYAVPVLLHPSFLIYNPTVHETLPGDLRNTQTVCSAEDIAALTALCTGLRSAEGVSAALPGIDLGLTGSTQPTPAPAGTIECRVPPDVIADTPVRKLFAAGDADIFVGGIGDVLRLEECAAAATGNYAYASDIVMCSIVNKDEGRAEICREYLDTLMNDGQTLAARAQAFPAIYGASAWEDNQILASVEEGLRGKMWLSGIRDTDAAYLFIEGKISADEAIERITKETRPAS